MAGKFIGLGTGYENDGIVFELDKKQYDSIQTWFRVFPESMARELNKEWKKELKPIAMAIRNLSYSNRGSHSIGRGPGLRTDGKQAGQKRRHTRIDLKWRTKFQSKTGSMSVRGAKISGRTGFGGWGRIGFSGRNKNSAQYIAFFHEYGTKDNEAREPLATGWKIVRGQADIERASDRAIDNVLKSKGHSR